MGFGMVIVGVILIVALIRSNERIRIAEIEAQRRLPPPVQYVLAAPRDEWEEWEDQEDAEWRSLRTPTAIGVRRQTAITQNRNSWQAKGQG